MGIKAPQGFYKGVNNLHLVDMGNIYSHFHPSIICDTQRLLGPQLYCSHRMPMLVQTYRVGHSSMISIDSKRSPLQDV